MNKDIGNRIRKIRIQKEIDTKKIADDIGIRDTSYSKIEREGTNSVDTLRKIASALGVKVTEFFEDNSLVAEPKEKTGSVSRDEWLQSNRDMVHFFKTEFLKLREELSLKKDPYKPKRKTKKTSKK